MEHVSPLPRRSSWIKGFFSSSSSSSSRAKEKKPSVSAAAATENEPNRRNSMSAIVLPKIDLDSIEKTPLSPLPPRGGGGGGDTDGDGDDNEEEDQSSSNSSRTSTPKSGSGSGRRSSGLLPSPLKKSPVAELDIRLDPLKPHASIQNTDWAARRFTRRLKRGPDAKDGPGFLFARRFIGDPGGDLYCELGISAAAKCGADGDNDLFMAFPETAWWPVQRRKFCKSLVFLLLDAMRVYRYETRKHAHTGHDMCVSVYKNTRTIVQDNVARFYAMCVDETMPILATKPVHKNWFVLSSNVAEDLIQTVTTAINGHWVP